MNTTNECPYGRCPICGLPGKSRERRLNGNDTCCAGHVYPSSEAIVLVATRRELAAKAAGIDPEVWVDGIPWSPETESRHAFALACQLSMDIRINQISVVVECGGCTAVMDCNGSTNREAVTRRAIVACAAEVGRQQR